MASATGTVRHPKGPAQPPSPPNRAGEFLRAVLDSSVGAKVIVGLTGAGLVGFTIFHTIGNLKLLPGGPESRDALNAYAHFLKHDLGLLLWFARGGLLAIFVLHLAMAIRLKLRAAAARPVAYAHPGSVQAGVSSRTMIWTGIVIGLFVLFHLAHYTFGWIGRVEVSPGKFVPYLDLRGPNDPTRQDVYEMTVAGFRDPLLAVLYLVGQVALFVHLRHGVPSVFQTLGLKNARFRGPIDVLGLLVALTVLLGNSGIVLAVQFGFVKSQL